MVKGTTEALVHVSISSSNVQVSRHLAMVKGTTEVLVHVSISSLVPLNMPSVWKPEHLRMI
jgi:hypothetical protein